VKIEACFSCLCVLSPEIPDICKAGFTCESSFNSWKQPAYAGTQISETERALQCDASRLFLKVRSSGDRSRPTNSRRPQIAWRCMRKADGKWGSAFTSDTTFEHDFFSHAFVCPRTQPVSACRNLGPDLLCLTLTFTKDRRCPTKSRTRPLEIEFSRPLFFMKRDPHVSIPLTISSNKLDLPILHYSSVALASVIPAMTLHSQNFCTSADFSVRITLITF
jgi:hypothetical protein